MRNKKFFSLFVVVTTMCFGGIVSMIVFPQLQDTLLRSVVEFLGTAIVGTGFLAAIEAMAKRGA